MVSANGMKECRLCHTVKPVGEFHTQRGKNGALYVKYCCKACNALETKRQYHENPKIRAKVIARSAARAKTHPPTSAQIRRYNLKRSFGLSEADYEMMRTEQGDKCALCGTSENGRDNPGSKRRTPHWDVDHCHKTGKIRGLLCHACNARLGSFEMMIDTIGLSRILAYIGSNPNGEQGS